jgi:ribonuclease HI
MTYDPYALTIHIDGSALDNPGGEGGIAGIVVFPEKLNLASETIFELGFTSSTNNRMELLACINALEWVRLNASTYAPARVVIITDSQYIHENQWNALFWRRSRWCNKDGRPVENPDLWKKFLAMKSKTGIRTDLEWQKGKSTLIQKEVDKEAKQSARNAMRIKDRGQTTIRR